jgi:hypothetical protein
MTQVKNEVFMIYMRKFNCFVQVGTHVLLNFDEIIWCGYVVAILDEASN